MEQASFRLMKALQERGNKLSVISLNSLGPLGPLLESADIPAVGLNYGKEGMITTILALRRAVAAAEADSLMLTGHNFLASIALAGVRPNKRLFAMHYHHTGVMPKYQWRMIYRAAVLQFQTITFPSDYVRREAEALYPNMSRVALTVRNPLEVLPLEQKGSGAQFRKNFGIPLDASLIGNAGWLIPRKRFDVFLQTAKLVREKYANVHFVIAGDGECRNTLEALCYDLGLQDHIHFTGWLSDLTDFYSAIDVLLFNSDWDAFPTTPIEAMGKGIPVVASLKNGGLSEILSEQTGWILNHHNPSKLAEMVWDALGAEGLAKGLAGRQAVLETSSPSIIAKTIENRLKLGG